MTGLFCSRLSKAKARATVSLLFVGAFLCLALSACGPEGPDTYVPDLLKSKETVVSVVLFVLLLMAFLIVIVRKVFQSMEAAAIRENEVLGLNARLGRIIENSVNEIFVFDAKSLKFLQVNNGARDNLGYSQDELAEMTPVDIKPDFTEGSLREKFAPLLNGETESMFFETRHRRKDGSDYFVEIRLQGFLKETPPLVVAFITDITQRKAIENNLQTSRSMLQNILDTIPVRVFWKDLQGGYLGCNRAFAADAELAHPRDVIGKTDFDMIWKEDAHLYREDDAKVMATGIPKIGYEETLKGGDGSIHNVITSKISLKDPQGETMGVLCCYEDVTEFKKAEASLRSTEDQYASILKVAPEAIITVDIHQTINLFNSGAEKIFGYRAEEVLGRNIAMLLPERFRKNHGGQIHYFSQQAETTLPMNGRGTITGLRKDSGEFPAEATVLKNMSDEGPMFTAILTDVSERQMREPQLRQAQKMEAIGKLTGGVAHDFNNLLAIVKGSLELMEDNIGDDPAQQNYLKRAAAAVDRGGNLTRRMLAFSRKQPQFAESVDLAKLVNEMIYILSQSLGDKYEIEIEMAEDLWPCRCDLSHLESIVLNLLTNARDAMPEEGTITIRGENIHITSEWVIPVNVQLPPGDYVAFSISDTGQGIKPENLEQIFDPFFTTKEIGKGTGLGLSMVYGYVKQEGGEITVKSIPGEGTVFTLYFPRAASVSSPD